MISNITSTKAKTHAQLHSHQETKPLVFTYLLYNLPVIMKNKSAVRPSDIRKKLPENWQKIQYADLTDILNSFIRIGILAKVDDKQSGNTIQKNTLIEHMTNLELGHIIDVQIIIII